MGETPVAQAEAEVMLYHEGRKAWVSPEGMDKRLANVQILQNTQRHSFRIVAVRQEDGQWILDCNIHHRLKYHTATSTFHQWRDDQRQVYGLNFAAESDARRFVAVMGQAIDYLNQAMNGEYQVPEPCGPVYQDPQQHVNGMGGGMVHNQSAPTFHGGGMEEQQQPQMMQFRKSSQALPSQHQMSHQTQQAQQVNRRASQGSNVSNGSSLPGNVYAQTNGASPSRTAPPAPPAPPPAPPSTNGAPGPPAAPPLPPVSGSAPPPPPPPPPNFMATDTAKPTSLADQIKAAKLNKAPSSASGTMKERSMSMAETSSEKSAAPARGAGPVDLLSELAATINRRKNTMAAHDALDSKSNISNGSSDSGTSSASGNIPAPPPAVPAKKWEPVKTNGYAANGLANGHATESPKTHRKVPSGSSISSQEDRPVANGVGKDQVVTPQFLEQFRTQLLDDVREEINRAKQDIIEALRQELAKR